MEVQKAGAFTILEKIPDDPQAEMIERCLRVQTRLGLWDDKITSLGVNTYCLPKRTLHQLDMGVQECSEAWDMLEGGWKHHKKQPGKADRTELLMELVDVAHFVYNAYLYMGGQSDAELVASAMSKASVTPISYPKFGMDEAWSHAERVRRKFGPSMAAIYGHGDGAYGEEWEKVTATMVNILRVKLMESAEAIRGALEHSSRIGRDPRVFPPACGIIFNDTIPWLYAAVQSVPDCTMQEFYSAFVHKNDINLQRIERGY